MDSHARAAFVPKLFQPDEAPDPASQTLRQFFESWYAPRVLEKERDNEAKTADDYRACLTWWEQLTDNPPLHAITRDTLGDFRTALRSAKFQRGSLPSAKWFPLSKDRQAKIARSIRAVVFRTGPDNDPKRPAAEFVPKAAHIPLEKIDAHPQPGFSMKRAQRLAAASVDMAEPTIRGVSPANWWRSCLSLAFYTGLRIGTVLRLDWSMVSSDEYGQWIRTVEIKTGKTVRIAVHADLADAIEAARTDSPYLLSIDRYRTRKRRRADPRAPQMSVNRLAELHARVQQLAGVPEAQWLSPQAWRRTHIDQLIDVGYHNARSLAQAGADHGEAGTTEGHYVDVVNKFRRRLPSLFPKTAPGDRQQKLF